MKTIFELIDESSQAKVAKRLKVQRSYIHRVYHATLDVRLRFLRRCETVFGPDFDFERTLSEWTRRHAERAPSKGRAEARA